MKKCITSTIAIVGVMFFLALSLSSALAQPIADPVLYFNPSETDQDRGDKVWRNAGTAGGELEHTGDRPLLEEGVIEIKSIGLKEEMKWYTPKQSPSVFSNGAKHGKTPDAINLEDFTIGLLVKINGPMFAQEHHLMGIQASPREQVQNFRIWLDAGGNGDFGGISIAQGAIGARDDWPTGTHQIRIGEQEWHWVHMVFESGDSFTSYIDGEKVSKTGSSVKWSDKHDMVLHGIFSHSSAEQVRTCNCSISIYRVYDRAFDEGEVNKNVTGSFAVEPADKLATTWGKVKRGF